MKNLKQYWVKPFITTGLIMGIPFALIIILGLQYGMVKSWVQNVFIIYIVSLVITILALTVFMSFQLWLVVSLVPQVSISYLKQKTNPLFFFAVLIFLTAIIDFVASSVIAYKIISMNHNTSFYIPLIIGANAFLVGIKIIIIKKFYSNYKQNFERGSNV